MLLEDRTVGLERLRCRWTGTRDPGVREAPSHPEPQLEQWEGGSNMGWGARVVAAPGKGDTSSSRRAELAVRMGPSVPGPAGSGLRGQRES